MKACGFFAGLKDLGEAYRKKPCKEGATPNGGSDSVKTMFDKTEITNLKLKNRLFRSATWEGLANPDGTLTDEVYKIYEALADGGVGTIITGLTDVSPYDWALTGNMRICSDTLIPDYKKLTDIVRARDCNILAQLNMNHYVREEKRDVKVDINDLTINDIQAVIELFVQAALRAEKAGFSGVQIHLAYGWLLNRIINPQYNRRIDEYGGTVQNRARIVVEILKAIKAAIPNLHITAKFSFYDNKDGNIEINDCVEICRLLTDNGIHSIEVLGGHSPKENNPKYESCYLDLAQAVKCKVNIPIILTGGNHDIDNMERLLNETDIEYFAMSRPLIREPDLPNRWLNGDRTKAKCISCSKCYQTHGKRCIFNK